MILTLDIGNTHIKVGAWDNGKLAFVSRLQTNRVKTKDEYAVNILNILQINGCNNNQFDGGIIACVVPPLSHIMLDAVKTAINCDRVFLVGPGLKTGLDIKIDNPATLGADMVCAAVAALQKHTMPCIIISLGTATALFALDKDGSFVGGAVSAGVDISLDALARRTAQLPYISIEEPGNVIGTNTIDCMKSGSIFGTASMLDGMIARMRTVLGDDCKAVACGGLAPYIAGYCMEDVSVDDQLVLEGLRLIYYKNIK